MGSTSSMPSLRSRVAAIRPRLLGVTLPCVLATLATAANAAEPLRVFTTVPDLAALAREIGGDRVVTFSAVSGSEDPHFAEPKPSYVKELSRADVYIHVGMDLEVGYAANLLQNARNAKVLPGAPGHIVASAAIEPMDVPADVISRALGDVHPYGSPHFLVDPLSALAVADLIRQRLSAIRPDAAAYFESRAARFRAEVGRRLVGNELHEKYDGTKLALLQQSGRLLEFLASQGDAGKLAGWLGALVREAPTKVVDDHPIWSYFARTFGLDVVAHLEPRPGIQPTTKHLADVLETMKRDGVRLVVQTAYYDPRHARFVAEATGAKVAKLAHQVGALPGTDDYLSMVDHNVGAIARAMAPSR
jgi:ABC-type Zn uptake system ZnuABC Zn-binding protein ZnuA